MKFIETILKYKIFCALTTCILIACCHNISFAAGGPGPGPSIYSAALDNPAFPSDTVDAQLKKLSAGAWLMIDANTGTILSSKNPDLSQSVPRQPPLPMATSRRARNISFTTFFIA